MAGIHHYLFLSDPRTLRVIGEPKAQNHAVIALSEAVGMNVNSVSSVLALPFPIPLALALVPATPSLPRACGPC